MNTKLSVVKLVSFLLAAGLLAGLALIVPQAPVSHATSRIDRAWPALLQSTPDEHALGFAPATVDPVLAWNTFLSIYGGPYAAAIDSAGNVYMTGHTSANDAFVAKVSSNGNLLWNTPLGGTSNDEGRAIAVDGSGSVYVVGSSGATWGSPKRPFTPNGTRWDAFVAKLSSDGSLAWNTFLGGTGNDKGYGVAVSGGNVYAVGYSVAPWESPLQPFAGGSDAFVAKLGSGGELIWNTFRGGAGYESGYTAAADGSGVYVSWSNDDSGTSMTVAKLNSAGGTVCDSVIGGAGRGMAVGESGNVYVAGYFPTNGIIWDAFAAKLGSGCNLIWNTFLGGEGDDAGWGLALDGNENLYVTGDSTATWGTPIREYSAGIDAFAAKLNSNGTLLWHFFLGGMGSDSGVGIAADSSGNIYVAGSSNGTWGEPIQPYPGIPDAFVAKIASRFSISGQVHDANGNGFPGVTVSAGPGLTGLSDASGVYTLALTSGIYTLVPAKTGYLFTPVTHTVSVPPDATGQDFTIFPGPVSVTLPLSGTTNLPTDLTYIDTQGLSTTLHFPAGAVTETTTLVLTPTLAWGDTGFVWAGHAFNLTASQNDSSLPGFTFGAPVTVTIHYSNDDIRLVSEESQLVLRWWAGSEWQDAAQTCNPASSYTRDLANNVLSVPICHLSLFGLFGPTHQIYLPLVLRNH